MPSIPAFVIEEHHEALLVWNYAVIDGWIPETGNALLHADEHADMGCAHFRRPLRPLFRNFSELWKFTYEEVSIYEFIVAAIHQGILNRVCWLQPRPGPRNEQEICISSHESLGKVLRLTSGGATPGSDGVVASYQVQNVQGDFASAESLILDIDLDYFSCDQAENKVDRLEVSEQEYCSFKNDNYHFLRINQGSRVTACRENGKFYLYLKRYQDKAPCPLKVGKDAILARLELLSRYLKRNRIQPSLITVARSRISGYTPEDQSQYIEENLVRALSDLFEIDWKTLESIAPVNTDVSIAS
jgi:hypothetical protein